MSYEKKYEDALERASKLRVQNPFDTVSQMMEHVFPELAESEDEKIRKSITEFFKNFSKNGTYKAIPDVTKWIAWLEKQGEQKPTDKVEPKFKVGDWIIDNNIKTPFQITGISNEKYDVISIYGNDMAFSFREVEHFYHLWTIQDAKDGDILVNNNDNPFIFKGLLDRFHPDCPVAYGGIDNDKMFSISSGDGWWTDAEVYPATQKQRDFLFQKMHEAGYVWDAEKKELRKIKQESIWEWDANTKELKKIHVIDDGKAEMDYCFTKMMNGEKVSSAWSEEDERRYRGLHNLIYSTQYCDSRKELSDWLKSIKQRIGG